MFVRVRWFSGTGNTARAMAIVAEELEAAGHRVECREFADPETEDASLPDLVVLGFPVLGFGAPAPFTRFVRRLPVAHGTPAAVFAVCGATVACGAVLAGYSGAACGRIARLLAGRGYTVVGSRDLSYPENWTQVSNPPDPRTEAAVVAHTDPLVREAARDLAAGRLRVQRHNLPARALCACVAVLFSTVGRRFLGKLYQADGTCTGCGQCALTCPARAIRIRRGRPQWGLDCAGCNRCINTCPHASIQTSLVRAIVHGVVNIGAFVAAVVLAAAPLRALGLMDAAGRFLPRWEAGPLPGILGAICMTVSALLMFALASAVQLGPIEAILRWAARTSVGARLLSFGWTQKFRRYRASGFTPQPIRAHVRRHASHAPRTSTFAR
jgi:Pyruvate/2-oxoacid:ferredoxin oxidoreductase delta subunit